MKTFTLNHFLFRTVIIMGSILLTFLYGYGMMHLFGTSAELETFSWSFIFLIPFAIGVLTVWFSHLAKVKISFLYACFMPWLICIGVGILLTIATSGIALCILIGIPIFCPVASIGGLMVWILLNYPKTIIPFVLLAMLSPILAFPVEAELIYKSQYLQHTNSTIIVDAPIELVWQTLIEIDQIEEVEHRPSLLPIVGIPRPAYATLSFAGLGGERVGNFNKGLQFTEVITKWNPPYSIQFTIEESSDILLPKPLDLIEGEAFDLVYGAYDLEQLEDGRTQLTLSSDHYLDTRFNRYGAFWSEKIVNNVQLQILHIIQQRAEIIN